MYKKDIVRTIYISVDRSTLDSVSESLNAWATGDGTVCTTTDDLLELNDLSQELRSLIEDEEGGDVVLHL